LQSKGTGMYQLPDSDLVNAVKQLRYQIRNFSLQYFDGKAPEQPGDTPTQNFWKYMLETTVTGQDHHAYLMSEAKGPVVIQSFLWRLLVGEIFEKFCWAPSLRESMTRVYEALRSGRSL
jgi:hypothetical protein